MNEKTGKTQDKVETRGRKPKKLNDINYSFDTLEDTRKALADLTIKYLNMEITACQFRASIYAINSMIKLLSHGENEDMKKRIIALEKKE